MQGLVRASSEGDRAEPVRLPAECLGRGILKAGLARFATAMSPVVKDRAQARWPDGDWLVQCHRCVGLATREHMTAGATWDAYMLGQVLVKHLSEEGLIPEELDDNRREMLRYMPSVPPAVTSQHCRWN